MLKANQKLALFCEATMGQPNTKMAEGILRYGPNECVAVIDSKAAGKSLKDFWKLDTSLPIVGTLNEAIALGAEVLVLGTAPSGGRLPESWKEVILHALDSGMSVVNGLHDKLQPIFSDKLKLDQWIWDLRTPVGDLPQIGGARAADLNNTRVLMVGTDMAIGKMTAGLEIYKYLKDNNHNVNFLASGQTGVAIMGAGIPLDAYSVDHAGGAVERMVLESSKNDIVIVEGQGSLLHPGSTATLPLIRGTCPTHMILCHRARMTHLDTIRKNSENLIKVPPIKDVIALNEAVASAAGALFKSKVVGICLNTRELDETSAHAEIEKLEAESGLPVQDPVRFGAAKIANTLI